MTLSYKTISVNKQNADKQWIVVDASNQVLGRFSSKVAKILRGKQKTSFTPHIDCGDNVIVINANKIKNAINNANKAIASVNAKPSKTFPNTFGAAEGFLIAADT